MAERNIASLQVLRAVAAGLVVWLHSLRSATLNPPRGVEFPGGTLLPRPVGLLFGSIGVDLFFVLSGFLMIHVAAPYLDGRRSPGDFLARRLIRVWPLFVLAMAAACAKPLLLTIATGSLHTELAPVRLLGSKPNQRVEAAAVF